VTYGGKNPLCSIIFAALMTAGNTFAVDKVYHPYVEPSERELAYRVTGFKDGDGRADTQVHRFGVGYGVTDHVAIDAYFIGTKEGGDTLKVEAYALELLWQLNEQGADWLDTALQFELEHAEGDYTELSVGFISEKEISARWSAAANFIAHYETGPKPKDDFEGEMAAQIRYRFFPQFEPAAEAYWDENVIAVGPAAVGMLQLDEHNRLKWQAAALQSTKQTWAHRIFRLSLEWEF